MAAQGGLAGSQEAEQEARLRAKYGALPKKKPLIKKGHTQKFFDSADWAMQKQGVGGKTAGEPGATGLQPKTAPPKPEDQ